MIVGLISDTHGLVRPEALAALDGSELIIHAGDIGGRHVLDSLAEIAPVTAVRGNVDEPEHLRASKRNRLDPEWASGLPVDADVQVGVVTIHVLHDIATLSTGVQADVVVVGHSHVPGSTSIEAGWSSTPAVLGRDGSGCRYRWDV